MAKRKTSQNEIEELIDIWKDPKADINEKLRRTFQTLPADERARLAEELGQDNLGPVHQSNKKKRNKRNTTVTH